MNCWGIVSGAVSPPGGLLGAGSTSNRRRSHIVSHLSRRLMTKAGESPSIAHAEQALPDASDTLMHRLAAQERRTGGFTYPDAIYLP